MKKKIAIIGSGITSCASALYFINKKYKVEVFEKKDVIGGILRDIKIDKKTFLSGPQYLEESTWINNFLNNKNLKNLLKKNNLYFGSFTDLFDKKPIFSNNFAHPITQKKFKNIKSKNIKTIVGRVESYQANISKPLLQWIKNFTTNINNVHFYCSEAMQIGRVYFKNSEKNLLKEKKSSKFADSLLGIPLKKKYKYFFTPRKGYDYFFKGVKYFLEKKGVKFYLNQPIKIKKEKTLKFLRNNNEIKADYYIWACNPVPLIKVSQDFVLDNPVVKISTLFFEVNSYKNISMDKYYQVFSNKTKINRIYIYKLSKRVCVNVECFFEKEINVKKIKKKTEKILKNFGHSFSKFDYFGSKTDLRHILYTENDLKSFKKFYKSSKFQNIIPGYWEEYGREKKISKLIKEFEKRVN